MNNIQLRMLYKSDSGFLATGSWNPGDYTGSATKDYTKWLEDFFPLSVDLHIKHKREFPHMVYKEWLEESVIERLEQVKSLIQIT